MRAAIFSDVHGNLTALDAVLADAETAGVDEFWVLGDLVANGPHPGGTLNRLMDLPNGRFVRGNTDRYVLTGDLPGMIDPTRDVQVALDGSRSFGWTLGAIGAAGSEWLAALPVEQRVTLPDGTAVLLVHASPGRDNGPGIQPTMTDQELRDAGVTDAGTQLIFVGHTHVPAEHTVDDVRVVNLGSVSLPFAADRRAMWTLLAADTDGFTIERRFAEYDIETVIAALDEEHHPSAAWLISKMRPNSPLAR
jgi:predicted phosphodiesterase